MVGENDIIVETAGDGVEHEFDASFKIFAETDIVAYKGSAADPKVYTLGVLNVDYQVTFDTAAETVTVAWVAEDPLNPGDFLPDPPVSGGSSVIARATARTQPNAFPRESNVPNATHEASYDRLELQIQELSEGLSRAPQQPLIPSSPDPIVVALPEQGMALYWDYDDDASTWYIRSSEFDLEAVEAAIEGAFQYSEGLYSAKPAAPTVNTYYYSTDNDSLELYIVTSGRWRLIG